jgi:rhomboid protease GluP
MVSIGASGAIFGLAGLLLGGTIKKQRYGYNLPIKINDLLFPVAAIFLIGLIPGLGVNNWAHFGGFISGVVLGIFLKNNLGEYRSKTYETIELVLYYLSLVILIVSFFLLLFNLARLIFA